MPGDQRRRAEEDQGRAAVDAAGPRRGQGPGRRARRMHPADPASAHRPGHRSDRTGARPVRAHPRQSVCPSCAERAKNLRAAQCREGWHLDQEPVIEPDDPTDEQAWLIQTRADAQAARDAAEARGEDVTGWDEELAELDEQINEAGMRGNVLPKRPERRHRSTRRRQDAPPLPKRAVDPRTVGKTYTTPDGKTFRPSLFITLTCPSYGRVTADGNAGRPGRLRLHRGGARRAALRRAVRPVHAEPAPVLRPRHPVLRRGRTATAPRPARPHRHARHRLAR